MIYHADTCQPLIDAARDGRVQMAALARGAYPGTRIPDHALGGLLTAGFWDAVTPQNWGLDWHRNEGIELTLLSSGHLPFAVHGQAPVTLNPGTLTITRPWQPHRLGDPNLPPCRLLWVILDLGVRRPNERWHWPDWIVMDRDDLARLTTILRHNEQPCWASNPGVRRCFEEIADSLAPPSLSRLAVRINELLLLLAELLHGERPPLDVSLTSSHRAVDLFLSELAREPDQLAHPWTVREMAERCGLGVTYFTRYCHEITNLAPAQHLNRLRIERAAQLLLDRPDLPVKAVSHACGFTRPQYFATAFQRHTGRSPTEHRSRAAR